MDGTSKRDASHTRHQGTRSHIPLAPKPQNTNGSKAAAITGAGTTATTRQVQQSSVASISSMEATFQEFNRRVAMTLLGPREVQPSSQILKSQQRRTQPVLAPKPVQQTRSGDKRQREEDNTGAEQEGRYQRAHILMPNLGKARILCRLCSKRGLKNRSRYGCAQCRLGFHVECFAVFHHPERYVTNLSDTVQDALDVISGNSTSRPATRRRENHSITSFEQLTLPTLSDIQEL
ncbi:hypothetical protein PI124_g3859 [Phytophthora idaei]|nr:hypothetical protein PI126_g3323 [Phytophthora idaei]KAG3251518.1 hypothetical protein PI124_g3859 [Phytophthora idaei]